MYDRLIEEIASRFNIGTPAAAAGVQHILSMMIDESSGGIDGFVDNFRRAGLGDAVSSWISGNTNHALTESQVESALGVNTLASIADKVGIKRATIGPVLAYLVPKLIDLITPKGRIPTTASLRAQIGDFLDTRPEPVTVPKHVHREPARSGMSWLPWIAIPALALLAWFFLRPPVGTIDPTLAVNNEGDAVTYTANVRDEEARSTIVEALNATFGADKVNGDVTVDGEVKEADWIPNVDEVVAALNTPGAELTLTGNDASVGGWLSEEERMTVSEKVRDALGTGISLSELGDKAAEAVRDANERAKAALAALDAEAEAEHIAEALNMSVINFATSSAELPAHGEEIVDGAAAAMQQAPEGAHFIITGHTDSTGDAEGNLELSLARAETVVNELVEAGVDPAMLTAEGLGDTQPVASNDTEYGRFQNRRIEYVVGEVD